MSQTDINVLAGRLEAILFLSNEPQTLSTLVEALQAEDREVYDAIEVLSKRLYESGSAIEIREMASGYQLFTRCEYQEFLEDYIASNDRRKLSGSSIETLAIVAYCQPVTRAQVSEIRGANSDGLLAGLVNKGYICEVGIVEESSATLFGTTNGFLDAMGILDINELPDLEQFAPDAEARLAIAERLGAIREQNSTIDQNF